MKKELPSPVHSTQYHSKAPEFYGFVAWTLTTFLFLVYVLWALLPDEYILWLGVEWYPSREWSLLLPAWSLVVVLLTYFTYMALTIYGTPAFDDISTITDSRAQLPRETEGQGLLSAYAPHAKENAVPELYDIPIELVNRVLYPKDSECSKQW